MRSAEGTHERLQGRDSHPHRVSPELAEFMHMLGRLEERFSAASEDSTEN